MEVKTLDSSTSGAASAKLNPLKVPLILENIFQFLGHQDLNACRQVSKLWNSYSRKAWSATGKVQVTSCGRGNPGSNVTAFVNFVRKRGMSRRRSLYTNFTLHGIGGIKTFWNVAGPFIKVLRLHCCTFASVDDFRNVVYKLTPNMRDLDLVHVRIRGPQPDVVEPIQWTAPQFGGNRAVTSLTAHVSPGSIPVSWMELLSHFPELKVLNLDRVLSTEPGRGLELFSTLAIILQQSSTEIKLRHTSDPACSHYTIPEVMLPQLVVAVELPQLRLESLCICMNGPDASVNLRRILVANAGSLRTLRLYRNDDSSKLNLEESFRLPGEGTQLEKLQEIGLIADGFETLSFLRFVPNLAKFTLTRIWCQLSSAPRIVRRTNLLEMDGVAFPNCTDLKVGYALLAQEIRMLRVLFPNVTKLRMATTDAELNLVRECWPDVDVERNELYTYWTLS